MATLLDAVNEALLQVGEREQTALTSPIAKKARLAVRSSVDLCSRMHAWRHLRSTILTTSWVNGVATLAAFQELYHVVSGTIILKASNPDSLQNQERISPIVGVPSYYAVIGENKVLVYPQPDVPTREAIEFQVLLEPTLPNLATDVIAVPPGLYELIVLYTQIVLHRTHTGDLASAEACLRDFEVRMHMYRTRENLQSVSTMRP
jgi:hypothetical protein